MCFPFPVSQEKKNIESRTDKAGKKNDLCNQVCWALGMTVIKMKWLQSYKEVLMLMPRSSKRTARTEFSKDVPLLGKYLPWGIASCSTLRPAALQDVQAPGQAGLSLWSREGREYSDSIGYWDASNTAFEYGESQCFHLLNIDYVPETVPGALCAWSHVIILILWTVSQRKSYYPHFMEKGTETQKDKWLSQGLRAGVWLNQLFDPKVCELDTMPASQEMWTTCRGDFEWLLDKLIQTYISSRFFLSKY